MASFLRISCGLIKLSERLVQSMYYNLYVHFLNSRSFPFSQGFKTADLIAYINDNFQMFKLVLEKAEEPEIKLPTSTGSWKKERDFQKNIYFCFIDYAKAFNWVDHNKLENSKQMGIPDHLTCLLRNPYAG